MKITATILGSGNIATWMAYRLKMAQIPILQVYSPTALHAQALAEYCHAEAISEVSRLNRESTVYIFSLKDDAYPTVIEQIPHQLSLAVMTAGSLSQNLLAPIADRFGILYPCQTISRENGALPFEQAFAGLKVPLCVEGGDEATSGWLCDFARKLSPDVYYLSEKQRYALHLAAVFASNFTNAMYAAGFEILQKQHIDTQLLMPLLQNTFDKLQRLAPWESQTGPARRQDMQVMRKHLAALEEGRLQEIYKLLSQFIIENTKS